MKTQSVVADLLEGLQLEVKLMPGNIVGACTSQDLAGKDGRL
jgi:hypothetical protein